MHRELIELAVVFLAAAGAHVVVTALGGHGFGPMILVTFGAAIIVVAVAHRWWIGRPKTRPVPPRTGVFDTDTGGLWLVRATVDDRPGRLAVLAGALAALTCDIRALQVHMSTDGPVDEFLVHMPSNVTVGQLTWAIRNAGGDVVHVAPAEIHDLIDPVSRALTHAAQLVNHPGNLPTALALMLSASVEKLHRTPAGAQSDSLDETSMYVTDPAGGVLALHRPAMPFTPTEYARAQVLAALVRSRQPDSP